MSIKKLSFLFLLVTLSAFGRGNHIIFVLDGSGSMGGTAIQQAKDAMLKTAKIIFENGDKVLIMIPKDNDRECNEELRLYTPFFSNMDDLKNTIEKIKPTGAYDTIPIGFEYAQKEMSENKYIGHIYMFGDCDGLEQCGISIESISNKYNKINKLTPFTYMQVDGCDGDEIKSWNKTFKKIGQKTGSASTFNYESIREEKIKQVKQSKSYFSNPKFINSNASSNDGKSYKNRPWRCVDSDGLFWLTITKKEQTLDFYIKKPSSNETKDISVEEYIKKLDNNNVCSKKDWRLPDSFELSRLTQLGSGRRSNIFPYIKIWSHISSSGGEYSSFKKGINLDDGQIYDYREDRPYAAIFVSGKINRDLFVPPSEYLKRYKVQNLNVGKATPTSQPMEKIEEKVEATKIEHNSTEKEIKEVDSPYSTFHGATGI